LSVVSLSNVGKIFNSKGLLSTALEDVNIEINEGEFLAITGPSGCGKSTLLSIMGLIDNPSRGTYVLADIDTSTLKSSERAQIRNRYIGFVFQSFNLIDRLSVFENVALPLRYRQEKLKSVNEAVLKALRSVGMDEYLTRSPAHLSGGQQQRVAIARAIVGSPELLVVDEPTGNLDSASGDQVMDLLSFLNEGGATIVMVTHNDNYTKYASREIKLLDGKLVS
jgi:putative ABC transport system ATP-binding protein